MRHDPNRLVSLNSWSPAGDATGGRAMEPLGGALVEELLGVGCADEMQSSLLLTANLKLLMPMSCQCVKTVTPLEPKSMFLSLLGFHWVTISAQRKVNINSILTLGRLSQVTK